MWQRVRRAAEEHAGLGSLVQQGAVVCQRPPTVHVRPTSAQAQLQQLEALLADFSLLRVQTVPKPGALYAAQREQNHGDTTAHRAKLVKVTILASWTHLYVFNICDLAYCPPLRQIYISAFDGRVQKIL